MPLTVTTTSGKTHRFTVEVARTVDEQAQGLMNRQTLAPDRGMIFPYDVPTPASFWMKNTLIPLDMIFIRSDGTVARIEANTAPLSLDPVAGGRARHRGARTGRRALGGAGDHCWRQGGVAA